MLGTTKNGGTYFRQDKRERVPFKAIHETRGEHVAVVLEKLPSQQPIANLRFGSNKQSFQNQPSKKYFERPPMDGQRKNARCPIKSPQRTSPLSKNQNRWGRSGLCLNCQRVRTGGEGCPDKGENCGAKKNPHFASKRKMQLVLEVHC